MRLQEAREFVAKFNNGDYSPDENAAFLLWLKEASSEELTIIADTHESMIGNWALSGGPSDEWVMQLERKLDASVEERRDREMAERGVPFARVQQGRKVGWSRWMVAASVAVVFLAGAYVYYMHREGSRTGALEDRERALTMTVSNPRGNAQKAVILGDGSKVWLYAGSELKYPPRFSEKERLVDLKGEAFFDVAGGAGSPFRVLIRDAEVEVLGTSFDVMAYNDEPESRTTLVEGALKISTGAGVKVLHPGQEERIIYATSGAGAAVVLESVDTKLALARKDGVYYFQRADLQTILRVLARTYDLTIHYQLNTIIPPINGSLDLNKGLDTQLQLLRSIIPINIQIKIDKGTLTVTSNRP
jgi:ferric-dicitrate binding protein FerR (iron transport regulator)